MAELDLLARDGALPNLSVRNVTVRTSPRLWRGTGVTRYPAAGPAIGGALNFAAAYGRQNWRVFGLSSPLFKSGVTIRRGAIYNIPEK